MRKSILHLLRLILAGIGLALCMAAQPPVYYVSPTGNDSTGDGSAGNPWASLSKASAAVPDVGATVIVRDGTYTGRQSFTRRFRQWTVFRAEHPFRAVLRNPASLTVSFLGASYVELAGFDIARAAPGEAQPTCGGNCPLGVHFWGQSDHIVLRGNLIHDAYNNDVIKINEQCHDLLFIENILWNAGAGGAGQLMDINSVQDVTVRDSIFFNDLNPVRFDTNGFIIVKDSDPQGIPSPGADVRVSRRTKIANNIFLNWQGAAGAAWVMLGEDGLGWYNANDVLIENNLFIGNLPNRLRAALSVKSARNVLYRNNTITGDYLNSYTYAARLTAEGIDPANQNVWMSNNIWSSGNGRMAPFLEAVPALNFNIGLWNNVYWNGGNPIAQAGGTQALSIASDPNGITGDPRLAADQGNVVLPEWTGSAFASGSTTIRQEFIRLAQKYGTPDPASAVIGKADPWSGPATDILDRLRSGTSDPGALETVGTSGTEALRLVMVPETIAGGQPAALNQVILGSPAGAACGAAVQLTSSDPQSVSVPDRVAFPPGAAAVTFTAATRAVSQPQTVTITASYTDCAAASVTRSATLAVMPERLTVLIQGVSAVSGTAIPSAAAVANGSYNTVLFEGTAPPEGSTIALSTDRPDVISFSTNTVNVPGGGTSSNGFIVRTGFVAQPTLATIRATAGKLSGSTRITVFPPGYSLQMWSDSTGEGLSSSLNTVTLDQLAPPGGAEIQLAATPADVISLPASVTISEGQFRATFSATALHVTQRTSVTVTASWNGRTATWVMAVSPVRLYAISAPASIKGGTSAQARVLASWTTPIDMTVTLAQSGAATLTLPDRVVIPSGSNSAYFTIAAPGVQSSTQVTVSGAYNGTTVTAAISIDP